MKRLRSIVLAVVVAAGAIISMLPAQPVSAVTSSASLSIEPRKNYVIKPGDSVKDNLIISNLSNDSPLELSLRVIDFTYTNDGGTPKLMLSPTAPQTTWSLKPFMTVPKNVTIQPNSTKKIPMSVAIPNGHGAGSYYSAIVYSSGSGSGGGNVGLSASGVTLVFTTIPGKVKEHLALTHLGAYHAIDASHPNGGYMSFAAGQPDMIGYTMKNSGNVTESPAGSITLKNIFGKKISISNINPQGALALIGQTRTFTPCIKLKTQSNGVSDQGTRSDICDNPHLWPGYYSVHLDAFYGQNGNQTQEVIGNGWFWYLPTWFLIVCALVLLVLIYVGWRVYRFVQKLRYGAHRPRRR